MTVVWYWRLYGFDDCGLWAERFHFSIAKIQYEELQLYDGMVILDTDADKEDKEELKEYLRTDKEVEAVSEGYLKKITAEKDEQRKRIYLYAPQSLEENKKFLHYRDRRTIRRMSWER